MTDARENVLYVRMLGGFSVTWNGKLIAGGSKANGSQFAYLLQILIHNREKGVTRDRLEELLFEDREMSNIHHALQSVIYNAKKRLEQAGLPPAGYIEQRKGVFFWTSQIEVVEDAASFDELYQKAEKAEKKAEKKHEEPEYPAEISIDEFFRCKIQAARVLACEKVEKSSKLLKFRLSLGKDGERTVVSGIQKYYDPEKLIGRQVAVITNLKTAKLAGIESQGMILSALNEEDGALHLVSLEEGTEDGAVIG